MKRFVVPRRRLYEIGIAAGLLLLLSLVAAWLSPYHAPVKYSFADKPNGKLIYYRAKVQEIQPKAIKVQLLDGPSRDLSFVIAVNNARNRKDIYNGATVLLYNSPSGGALEFYGLYRVPLLLMLVGIFIVVVVLVGRRRGVTSLIGLVSSVIIIGWMVIPMVLAGYNALLVSVSGAFLMAIVSIIIAHGFHLRTFISLVCILGVLVFVTVGSWLVVSLLGFSGVVDDSSYYLSIDHPKLDLSGIVVGGIVIATLGALDDIVTTQVAAVEALHHSHSNYDARELFKRASVIGGEHIAGLVNTLVLVYVGAALPLIIAYCASTSDLFSIVNGEFIATELARTILVSIGLVLAVPLSTYAASVVFTRTKPATHRKLNRKLSTNQ